MKPLKRLLLLAIGVLLVGCGEKEIVGTEKIITQVRPISTFSDLDVRGYYAINASLGKPQTVTVTANGNLLPYIETTVSGKTLVVQTKKGYRIRPQGRPAITIVVPQVTKIDASGDNQFVLKGLTDGGLKLVLSGTHVFTGQGSVKSFSVKATGNTIVDAQKLIANDVNIDSSGNVKVLANVREVLDVSIEGTGFITYLGNPSVKQSIHGSGNVTKVQEIINK